MARAQSFPASEVGQVKARVPARRRVLVFYLGGQAYALPVAEVQEILPMAALSRPPGLPSVLAGFLNLAGRVVPVVRLDRLFALADQPVGLYTPLLVLRNPDFPVALLVERVSEILDVAGDAVVPVPEDHSFNDCAEGLLLAGDRVVLLLAAARLLLEKEQQQLAELQDREQARLRALEGEGS